MASVKRRGRPTSLTPEVHDAIVQAIRAGNYLDDSAAYAGVGIRTVYVWLERGHAAQAMLDDGDELPSSESVYLHFMQAVESARSQAVVRNVALIQRAAETNWQAAAWYLERTNPRKWGRNETVTLTGEPDERSTLPSAKDTLAAKVAAIEAAARTIVDTDATEAEPEPAADTKPEQPLRMAT